MIILKAVRTPVEVAVRVLDRELHRIRRLAELLFGRFHGSNLLRSAVQKGRFSTGFVADRGGAAIAPLGLRGAAC